MPIEIVPFRQEHLAPAAELVAGRYRAERQRVGALPARYEDPAVIGPMLERLRQAEAGVAALRAGRLAGFLVARLLPAFRGKRSTYAPEWAHAATGDDRRRIYRDLYGQLSARWVANGCLTHVITLLAGDREVIDAWFWSDFGLMAVDAVRGLGPVETSAAPAEIRRARPDDADAVVALGRQLQRHMAAAPTFLPAAERRQPEQVEKQLADPARPTWLALRGGKAVAQLGLGPASTSAAHVIRDEKTASITGAFTRPDVRGQGIATALLDHALRWARQAGCECCAVDFEPQNPPAARFWLRHFQPVCYSLARHVDSAGDGQDPGGGDEAKAHG